MDEIIEEQKETKITFKFVAFSKEGIEKILNLTTKTNGKTTTKKISPLTSADLNLLFFIINRMNFNNLSTLPVQKEIKNNLNLSQKQISTSLHKLIKLDFIIKVNQPRTYFLNPKFIYLGTDRKNKIIEWKRAKQTKSKS